MDTLALTLFLLWTNTTADSGQGRGLLQHLGSSQELTTLNILDERRDVDVHGTALHAAGLCTVQTTLGLRHCHLFRQADVYFLRTGRSTIHRVKLWHYHTLNLRTLLRLHRTAQRLTPLSIAVGERLCPLRTSPRGGFCCVRHFCVPLGRRQGGNVLLIMLQLFLLLALKGVHALEHLVPVNESTIELRTVDADELRLAADGQTTGTAHTRTIHHDGVQAHLARNVVLLSRQVRELHHDGRANGKHLIDVLLLDELLNADGYDALLAVRTVVGHDDDFVRTLAYLVF